MKNLIAPLLLLGFISVSQSLHAEGGSNDALSFWEKLRIRIEQMTPQKKVVATTAVGGVRGAKMATDDVYWKGEKITPTADADELDAFKMALALAAAGELDKAQLAFADFVSHFPESTLRAEADQALAQLQTSK